jgi:hypothetical protein
MPTWLESASPSQLGVFLGKKASARKAGLFIRHLCRCFPEVFTDPRSWAALVAADSREVGEMDEDQLKAAILGAEEARIETQDNADAWPRLPDYIRILHAATAARIAKRVATSGFYPNALSELRAVVLQSGLGGGGGPRKNPIARAMRPLVLEHFGDIENPVAFDSEWRTSTVVALAQHIHESRDFSTMPILADALQDAVCDNADILSHCRDTNATHVRGCWVVDMVLGKS